MKTTIEIDEPVFRRAKVCSAGRGITFKQFITEAVEEKLRSSTAVSTELERPWMKGFGALADLKKENAHVMRIIENEFEQIDMEDNQ